MKEIIDDTKGNKLDAGKNRLDLIPPNALEEIAKIFTFGSNKYGDYNWSKGIKWSKLIGSMKRHLTKFEKGLDYDEESNLYELAHLATNAIMLLEYYKIAPEMDDRQHKYLQYKKIGLDIDEVLSDFVGDYCKKYNIDSTWKIVFNFIVVDKYQQVYCFEVSRPTMKLWMDKLRETMIVADWHYSNKSFDLPHQFCIGQVML